MKLIGCHIDNFGGLHDYDMNFDEGINIVLHDNGWGKTTLAAFLKAMLYGFDSRRSKDITENERKRYLPWQGGQYGGSLDIEIGDDQYRIHRTFGETPRFDKVRVVDLKTQTTAKIDSENLGESLFHLDASAFQRSVFINQNGLSIDGAASSIHTRLNALVSEANDLAVYDDAIAKLTAQIKVYEKTGQRGQIGDITRQIAESERTRDRMETDIAEQDAARERITEIDILLASIREDIEKKKAHLEEISGEAKKREASREMLNDLTAQIADLQKSIDALGTDLGGTAPDTAEIDRVKSQQKDSARYEAQLAEFAEKNDRLSKEYHALSERYSGGFPTAAQMDEIQRIYGELRGIQNSGEEAVGADAVPEGYDVMNAVLSDTPAYSAGLNEVIATEASLQQLLRKEAGQAADIKHEEENWNDKKHRYEVLTAEAEKYRPIVEAKKQYAPAAVSAAIRSLEDLQEKQQSLTKKLGNLDAAITHESESWNEKRQRYTALSEEAAKLESEIKGRERFRGDAVQPVISQLEDLQKKQQLADLHQSELAASELTAEERALTARFNGELPNASEGRTVIENIREVRRLNDDNHGLRAMTDGETGKADSIRVSIDRLGDISETASRIEAPHKPSGGVMIGVGAGMTVLSAVLAVLVNPVLAVLAAVGIVLIVLGVTGNKNYKVKLEAFEKAEHTARQQNELASRRKELEAQLESVLAEIAELKKKIDGNESRINTANIAINSWAAKWLDGQTEVSESAVQKVLDDAEKAKKASEKQTDRERKALAVTESAEAIRAGRIEIDAAYPEISGKTFEAALSTLRTAQTEYQVALGKYEAAVRNKDLFLSEADVSAEAFSAAESPKIPALSELKKKVGTELDEIETGRKSVDDAFPEIKGLSFAEAQSILRSAEGDYKVAAGQYDSAVRSINEFLNESKLPPEAFASETSPMIADLSAAKAGTEREIARLIEADNAVLGRIGLHISKEAFTDELVRARRMIADFRAFDEKQKEKADRQQKRADQITALETRLAEELLPLKGQYEELPLPERLTRIREDIGLARDMKEKLDTNAAECQRTENGKKAADSAIAGFVERYLHFTSETADAVTDIEEKAGAYRDLVKAKKQLEDQRDGIAADMEQASFGTDSEEETSLRAEIKQQEDYRDELLMEYQKKGDTIRQADRSLEAYPDILQEIKQLYDQKQKAQNTLVTLKRAIQKIRQAKENLANRYLSKVEQLFNNYLHIWINNEEVRGILDIDFNLQIEENDKAHAAQGYSTGYCDMLDFCMRLALVDTLFESEQPFLILDDPFVNLDEDRLEKALELLNVMAASKQIVYFVCHPVRALDKEADSRSREKFARLAEETRKTLEQRKTSSGERKKLTKKLPREMYKVVNPGESLPIRPAKPNYTITNSIFSLNFVVSDELFTGDATYELFFIDAVGRVLNERQIVEMKNGKLSTERVLFNLNTRDDSGEQYELMIRESGQEDYEVLGRLPFTAKIAFTGTSSFDFGL